MKIHHYTTIDNLALILKNKTIRFSRLDGLDDLEENISSDNIKVGCYAFASCWTEDSEESIPLWKMYTNNGIGVRISIDKDMFYEYENPDSLVVNGLPFSAKGIYNRTITPLHDWLNVRDSVMPVSTEEKDFIYKKIEYVDDINKATADIVKRVDYGNNKGRIFIQHPKIGKYKHKRWIFENETRFVLLIFPVGVFSSVEDFMKGYEQQMYSSWCNGTIPSINHYDMRLKDTVFDDMEITLSPSMSESNRIIVESLINRFAPKSVIKESSLEHKVVLK